MTFELILILVFELILVVVFVLILVLVFVLILALVFVLILILVLVLLVFPNVWRDWRLELVIYGANKAGHALRTELCAQL